MTSSTWKLSERHSRAQNTSKSLGNADWARAVPFVLCRLCSNYDYEICKTSLSCEMPTGLTSNIPDLGLVEKAEVLAAFFGPS